MIFSRMTLANTDNCWFEPSIPVASNSLILPQMLSHFSWSSCQMDRTIWLHRCLNSTKTFTISNFTGPLLDRTFSYLPGKPWQSFQIFEMLFWKNLSSLSRSYDLQKLTELRFGYLESIAQKPLQFK